MSTATTVTQLDDLNEHSHGSDRGTYILRAQATREDEETEQHEPPADAFESFPDGGFEAWKVVCICMVLIFW